MIAPATIESDAVAGGAQEHVVSERLRRVLVLEAAGNMWGSERALLDFVADLPRCRAAVCLPPATPLESELRQRGVVTFPYFIANLHESSKLTRIAALLGVLRACRTFRPDVLYLNQAGVFRLARVAARLFHIPVVAHVRIFEDVDYLARQSGRLSSAIAFVAISSAIEDALHTRQSLNGAPTFRLYDAYRPIARDARTGWKRAPNRIACVGRITPVKAQDVLIRALGILDVDVECLIVGDGRREWLDELRRIEAQLTTRKRIKWTGFEPDVVGRLTTCAFLVCPSHREPLGRVIFEAWDAGAVPIAFAGSGGAAEIIRASSGGILYQRQDPESLAETLRTALSLSQSDRNRLAENGRRWVNKHCDPVGYAAAMKSIFDEVAVSNR